MQEVYLKTMKLAVDLAQNKSRFTNGKLNNNDLKYLKSFEKEFTDFKKLKNPRPYQTNPQTSPFSSPVLSPLKPKKQSFLPKNSGKAKLHTSLQERKNFVSTSRAGKPLAYPDSGPGILERIKLNASVNLEDSVRQSLNEKPSNLPHISITTGKLKKPLTLPSFKEYIKSEKMKNSKDLISEKLEKCEKNLEDFNKELNGLEMFVNLNPGVSWNSDKKVLLRLDKYPKQRALIIKAYNDKNESPSGRFISKKNTYIEEIKSKKTEVFLSKTPIPGKEPGFYFPELEKRNIDPNVIAERCITRFKNAREEQNKKIISILLSLDFGRAAGLRNKAQFILNDNEKFKDRNYSLRKMKEIKKKLDAQQSSRLKKSKKQAILYDLMMAFLKKKHQSPSDAEINFVEIIKNVLEEGFYLDKDLIDKILENFEEFELKELQDLLGFLNNELNNEMNN